MPQNGHLVDHFVGFVLKGLNLNENSENVVSKLVPLK